MSYNFLIVDGPATARAMTKRMLRLSQLGYRVTFDAASADEALEVLADERVDLVLADLTTPGLDEQIIGRILNEPSTRAIPVVVTAANPDVRQLDRLRRLGVRGFLRKPLTPEAVGAVLTRILEPTHV